MEEALTQLCDRQHQIAKYLVHDRSGEACAVKALEGVRYIVALNYKSVLCSVRISGSCEVLSGCGCCAVMVSSVCSTINLSWCTVASSVTVGLQEQRRPI